MASTEDINAARLWAAELSPSSRISNAQVDTLIDTIRPIYGDGWLIRTAIEICEILASTYTDQQPALADAKRQRVEYLMQQPALGYSAVTAVITVYAAVKPTAAPFTATEMQAGASDTDDRITAPVSAEDYHLAFAVPEIAGRDDLIGVYELTTAPQFNQIGAFARQGTNVVIDAQPYEVWVSRRPLLADTSGRLWRLELVE